MCGRFRQAFSRTEVNDLAKELQSAWHKTNGQPLAEQQHDENIAWQEERTVYTSSHNVSPGQSCAIIALDTHGVSATITVLTAIWGLVTHSNGPPFDHWAMFNARSETLGELKSFAPLFRGNRRCIVPIQGFYEWKDEPGSKKKQPFYAFINQETEGGQEGSCMLVAGLYDEVPLSSSLSVVTTTLVTASANKSIVKLHDRMPLILPDYLSAVEWLLGGSESHKGIERVLWASVQRLYSPDFPLLLYHPVTMAMTAASYDKDDASLDIRKRKGSITSFFSLAKKLKGP
jgi:putative SOS response-associated peptidase YedK